MVGSRELHKDTKNNKTYIVLDTGINKIDTSKVFKYKLNTEFKEFISKSDEFSIRMFEKIEYYDTAYVGSITSRSNQVNIFVLLVNSNSNKFDVKFTEYVDYISFFEENINNKFDVTLLNLFNLIDLNIFSIVKENLCLPLSSNGTTYRINGVEILYGTTTFIPSENISNEIKEYYMFDNFDIIGMEITLNNFSNMSNVLGKISFKTKNNLYLTNLHLEYIYSINESESKVSFTEFKKECELDNLYFDAVKLNKRLDKEFSRLSKNLSSLQKENLKSLVFNLDLELEGYNRLNNIKCGFIEELNYSEKELNQKGFKLLTEEILYNLTNG